MEFITQKEFTERMQYLAKCDGDREGMHRAMDGLMIEVLEQFGYTEGCNIFENTPKWYA